VLFDIPHDLEWHRFEARVGVADWAASNWPSGLRARFLVIDDDLQVVLWESSDTLEPWAPTELCSMLLSCGDPSGDASMHTQSDVSSPRRICLRVQCASPPTGALWIEPIITVLKSDVAGSNYRSCRSSERDEEDHSVLNTSSLLNTSLDAVHAWDEVLSGELVCEFIAYLQCRDVAHLACAFCIDESIQQVMWHFAFAHNFRAAYCKYFLRPLQGQPRPPALPAAIAKLSRSPIAGTAACQVGYGHSSPRSANSPEADVASAIQMQSSTILTPRGRAAHGVHAVPQSLARSNQRGVASPPPMRQTAGQRQAALSVQACNDRQSMHHRSASTLATGVRCGNFVPVWALEAFDWWQICRRFHMAQLVYVSINFQLFNCMTPPGFFKDSGETFHSSRGPQGQGFPLGYGWNVPLGAEHFLSCPSAVVAHRSPLGVAGVPSSVATVRGTAGPEPLAMTPMVSERDSSVVLPQTCGQVRPQWTIEVEPGHYIVVATVGDRNVGFSAMLEVSGQPLFCGEWIEAGTFRSRCVLCVASRGTITVAPYWPRSGGGKDREETIHSEATGDSCMWHEAPPSPRNVSPRTSRNEALARGTRLVSLRVVSAPLAREVERERRPSFLELNQKIAEARLRLDCTKQVAGLLDKEYSRAHAKLADLQVQKAVKLFPMVSMYRRVAHPYIYLNGEVASMPPTGQPEIERAA